MSRSINFDDGFTSENPSTGNTLPASDVVNTPSGNLAATDQQSVNNELQADIDTRATSASLSSHESDVSTHGISVAIVGTTEIQTLTNKTLTTPVINSPTGIVKADVGLGNVDNTSDTTKNAATATLTNKTFDAEGTGNALSNVKDSNIKVGAAIALSKLAALGTAKALQSNASTGAIEASAVTNTELGYVSGVTSSIQTQLNSAALAISGSVQMYAGNIAPSGWLFCNGSAISRTTYAALFAIVGTTYGVGDGSTTFNLPNTQGVFVRGAGSQTISGIGYTGTRGTTQGDQMQGHRHPVPQMTINNGSTAANPGVTLGSASATVYATNDGSGFTVLNTSESVGSPNELAGSGTPRIGPETRPANISFNYMIKT